jgi:hypothetical protein
MQLDSDVLISIEDVNSLYEEIRKKGKLTVMAPLMHNKLDFKVNCSPKRVGLSKEIENLYHFIFCGLPYGIKKYGKYSSTTSAVSINPDVNENQIITEWLPGGCVIGFRDELIKENFYHREGKAFCEDILHSYLRNKQNIKHICLTNVKAYTYLSNQINLNLREYYSELLGRIYVGNQMHANPLKLYFFLCSMSIVWIIKKYILK